MCVDARMVIFAVNSGDVIERIVLCDRESEKALIENVRGADRPAVAAHRRVRLMSIKIAGLRRVGSVRWIGRHEIGITWDVIVLPCAAECIGMDGEVCASRVEQRCPVNTTVDGRAGAAELGADAATRNVRGNAIVGRLDDAADRLRAKT